jgi:hypothetical protein
VNDTEEQNEEDGISEIQEIELSVNSELNKDTELTFGNFLPELIKKYNL